MKELNYELMYGLAEKISSAVAIILGFIAVILTLWLGIVTAIDMMYISWPVMQDVLERKFDGKKFGGLRLLSEDARSAVEEAASSGGSAPMIYLRKRIVTYSVAAVLLVIIVTGGTDLRNIVANSVVNMLKALKII